MPGTLHFISDLHLPVEPNEVTGHFLSYLNNLAKEADSIYILGDLFETWVGDDVSLPVYQPVIEALKAVSDSGCRIFLMYGNRDFLMRVEFCRATGIQLINDPTVIQHGDQNLLLMHGDTLCTDDERYQKFRRTVRNPLIQFIFLNLPKRWRENMVAKIRNKTTNDMTMKSAEIMDVAPIAVEQAFRAAHGVCRHLIHGHTHRPATHERLIDGDTTVRHVLTDWQADKAEVLLWQDGSATRLNLIG